MNYEALIKIYEYFAFNKLNNALLQLYVSIEWLVVSVCHYLLKV